MRLFNIRLNNFIVSYNIIGTRIRRFYPLTRFFEIFEKYGGNKDGHVKLKRPKQLQEILDIARSLLSEIEHREADPEIEEKQGKLEQLKSVLEMWVCRVQGILFTWASFMSNGKVKVWVFNVHQIFVCSKLWSVMISFSFKIGLENHNNCLISRYLYSKS